MSNLVLITSVTITPNKPYTYTNIRSVYSRRERFEQTKLTIQSIKKYIPNNKILLVDCSDFSEEEEKYFEKECDYILNLWNKNELHDNIFGMSKALGEGTQTMEAFNYIIKNKIFYNNLIKISGRYWFNDDFDYNIYNNESLIFVKIDNNAVRTVSYKIPNNMQETLFNFLINNYDKMRAGIGFEILISNFLKSIEYKNTVLLNKLGISGYISVCGSFFVN
jgi:hypothetical protein